MGSVAASVVLAIMAVQAAATPNASEEAAIQTAIRRGALIYAYDEAAWHSTDTMKEEIPNRLQEVRGWVIEGDVRHQVATYFGEANGQPYGVFTADLERGKVQSAREIKAGDPERTLTPDQLRMAIARKAALNAASAEKVGLCANANPNTVIVPAGGGALDVYIMTPQTREDSYPAGGHYLFRVNAEGQVVSHRPFTRSCLSLGLNAPAPDKKPAAMMVSHLLDPTPTELHVFMSLQLRLPVGVATTSNNAVWMVEGVKITKIGDVPRTPPAK